MSSVVEQQSLQASEPTSIENIQDRAAPYSVFTSAERWGIVAMVAFAGIFSPFTANIYFPAIPAISAAFHKSTELINLTVTVYLVLQGASPMLWGTLSDYVGRRPIFIACLLLLSCSCVGLALVPTSAYWLLMLLRCLQAAGSASTIALGAGVIGDITTQDKRGGVYGIFITGPLVGPVIGPVIGGALAGRLGWRSIFWFLCIASAACLLFIVLFLPETLRALVGDGHISPPAWYRPIIPIIGFRKGPSSCSDRPPRKPFINPFILLIQPDILLLLIFNGVGFAAFYALLSPLSVLFVQIYGLSETFIGLCFLAPSGGMIFGGVITGKLLDRDYEKIKRQILSQADDSRERGMSPQELVNDKNFPIEMARLRTVPIYLAVYVACCVGYGWALHRKINLAVPLLLQFFFGYTGSAMLNTTQTLIIDLVPSQSSSATACNNFVRCSLGAAMVSIFDIILRALGIGWTYTLIGGLCLIVAPAIYMNMRIGPACRARRLQRKAA